MTLFIWHQVDEGLTQNWHSGGGVVVIAADESRARELVPAIPATQSPDYTHPVTGDEQVFIFPDAGCC